MGAPGTEREVKLPFASPADALERLRSLGATPVRPRELEDNVLYDLEGRSLRSSGRMLRLRRAGGRALLTFKAKVVGEGRRHKVRAERETGVDRPDELVGILEGLGFVRSYRYQKYRAVFHVGGVEAAVDETALGCFVELEGPADAIDRVAATLGFTPERYVLATYRDLHEEAAASKGVPVGDLLLDLREDPLGR